MSFPTKSLTYRKYKNINILNFKDDITASDLVQNPASDLEELVTQMDLILGQLLDKHAPQITRSVTDRPKVPWYNDHIKEAKRLKRKCERQMKKTQLVVHTEIYKAARLALNKAIQDAKSAYYNGKITEAAGDQKVLFRVVESLLHKKTSALPTNNSSQALASDFSDYFCKKIETIRNQFDNNDTKDEPLCEHHCECSMDTFTPLSEIEVTKIIHSSSSASCALDPIPTWLIKDCLDVLIGPITKLVNLSLSTGIFPPSMKVALVRPLIKNQSLDPDCLKNYRPVSNLSFMSKVIEKVVAVHLNNHIKSNNLDEPTQSAYKPYHSTETALLRVSNDILRSIDNKQPVLLVLLDLSAAFDTVDHTILIQRLQQRLGITGVALQWFTSYLTNRTQQVTIDSCLSDTVCLLWGVPQGSVLGPQLFSVYSGPIADIARKHKVDIHMYADDSQLYVSCDMSVGVEASISQLQSCISDIRKWMKANKLKLNDSKTEFMVLSSPYRRSHATLADSKITIGDNTIDSSGSARNLGVVFDSSMTMLNHITKVTQLSFMQLKSIRAIKNSLTHSALEKVIHAFITSRLDYGNSLFYGLPDTAIRRLQRIQNAAARLLSGTKKYDSITPVLKQLHWLPVRQRIDFKVLLITFKALNDLAPNYLKDVILTKQHRRSLRNKTTLYVPRTSTKSFGDRAFSAAAPKLWNSLPADTRAIQTLSNFKKAIKTHLFKSVFL